MTLVHRILFFGALLIAWALLAGRGIWDATLFPSPIDVAKTFVRLLLDGSLLDAVEVSMRRVLVGYGISLVIGIPLGVLLARRKIADDTLGALVSGLRSLPSICWIPLALLWFGPNDRPILFVVVMGSMVSIASAVRYGVKSLSPVYVRAAQTMGTTRLRMVTDVLLPASVPAILVAAKQGWSLAWRTLMCAELLYVGFGLGRLLVIARNAADISQILSVMAAIAAIGLVIDCVIFGYFERQVRRNWGLGLA